MLQICIAVWLAFCMRWSVAQSEGSAGLLAYMRTLDSIPDPKIYLWIGIPPCATSTRLIIVVPACVYQLFQCESGTKTKQLIAMVLACLSGFVSAKLILYHKCIACHYYGLFLSVMLC